jgi:hypothetical protein
MWNELNLQVYKPRLLRELRLVNSSQYAMPLHNQAVDS